MANTDYLVIYAWLTIVCICMEGDVVISLVRSEDEIYSVNSIKSVRYKLELVDTILTFLY